MQCLGCGSNLKPLDLKSSTLPLSHGAQPDEASRQRVNVNKKINGDISQFFVKCRTYHLTKFENDSNENQCLDLKIMEIFQPISFS